MRLAAIRRAEEERNGAVLFKLNASAVDAARTGHLLHLGKDRHIARRVPTSGLHTDDNADAEQTTFCPFPRLLVFKLMVSYFLKYFFKKGRIVPAVVNVSVGRGIGHLARLNEVDGANINRAHLEFLGDPIHDSLPDEAHARLADSPIRDDRALVGHHRVSLQRDILHLIGVGQVIELIGKVDGESADRATDIVDFFES